MAKRAPRLLLIEDDQLIRSSVEISLCGEGYVVEARADATGLGAAVERFRPDLAILDVRLPQGPDGFAAARSLRTASDMPILFLTAADRVEERLAGFAAGGDDYLLKPFSTAELLARILVLLRRSGRLTAAALHVGDLMIDDGARTAARGGTKLDLTRKEHDLLFVMARHRGQVLSKVQLLCQVWDFDAYDTNLVEVHMSSLRRKLERHGPRIIHTVRGVGYVLRG